MTAEQSHQQPLAPHDEIVLEKIAQSVRDPKQLDAFFERSGRLSAALLDKTQRLRALRFLPGLIDQALAKGLEGAVETAARAHRPHEVRRLFRSVGVQLPADGGLDRADPPLEVRDRVAQAVQKRSLVLMGTEGVLLGSAASLFTLTPAVLVALPGFLSADVFASLTFLARHCFLLAQVYGFPATEMSFRLHILMAMAPLQRSDVEARRLGLNAALDPIVFAGGEELTRASRGHQAAKRAAGSKSDLALALRSSSPHFAQVLRQVGARLERVFTQKQAGLFVPLAGGALNGALNLAFQKMSHRNAQQYFQLLYLAHHYGSDRILDELNGRLSAAAEFI